jgi:hypothetical protein
MLVSNDAHLGRFQARSQRAGVHSVLVHPHLPKRPGGGKGEKNLRNVKNYLECQSCF